MSTESTIANMATAHSNGLHGVVPQSFASMGCEACKAIVSPATPAPRDRDLSLFAMSFPAVNGEWVLQGHADYCAANGHATHTVDGVTTPYCPRCGDRREPVTVTPAAPAAPAAPAHPHTYSEGWTVWLIMDNAGREISPMRAEGTVSAYGWADEARTVPAYMMSTGDVYAEYQLATLADVRDMA